jgi:dCMP deaminase
LTSTSCTTTPNRWLDKWDSRFLRIAEEVRRWSKDPGTTVGCVLVKERRILATGYNGFPANLSDSLPLYQNRDYKLAVVVHAEKNALFNAAKNGANTESCTAYVTFPPCSQCAAALIQAGVRTVVCPNPNLSPERWRQNFLIASDILSEAGVRTLYYSEADLDGDADMRHLRGALG